MVYVLGIESTAHTFGVGIIDDKYRVVSDIRYQFKPPSGMGIEPFMAAEHHSVVASEAVRRALYEASLSVDDLDGIGYSMGPGLGPCLRIGATVARALSAKYGIPLYPVNHAIGHIELVKTIYSLKNPLILLISGGHTVITAFKEGRWRSYGETLDITVGNLMDVFAREAGLGFPGGPKIEAIAREGSRYIELPYTIKGSNFQFSGLLTRAIQMLKDGVDIRDLSYSLQETAFSVVVEAMERALASMRDEIDSIAVTGGVAANDYLFEKLDLMARYHGLKAYRLDKKMNGDNGVQIAIVAIKMLKNSVPPIKVEDAIVKQRWRFDEVDIRWT